MNIDLQEEYDHEKKKSIVYEQMSPLPKISQLAEALDDADLLTKEISTKKDEYKELTKKLRKENQSLREQNENYQTLVEKLQSEQHKKEMEYKNKLRSLEQKLMSLNDENMDIIEQREAIQQKHDSLIVETDNKLREHMQNEIHSPNVIDDQSLHIKFVKSSLPTQQSLQSNLSALHDGLAKERDITFYMQKYVSNPQLQFLSYNSMASLPGTDNEYDDHHHDHLDDVDESFGKQSTPSQLYTAKLTVPTHGTPIMSVDENTSNDERLHLLQKQNEEFEKRINIMKETVKQKDAQIAEISKGEQQKTEEISQLKEEIEEIQKQRQLDVQKMERLIVELQQKNTLLSNDGENTHCFIFDWFK